MSGRVHVKGDASQSAGATGCGGLLVIDGNASARCGISLRGHRHRREGLGRAHVGLHGAGRQPGGARRCRRCAGRFASTRRGCTCAASVKSLGADCIEKAMRDEHKAAAAQAARCGGRRRRGRRGGVPALRLGAQALQFPHRQPGVVLMSRGDDRWMHTPPRKSATFDAHAIAEIHRAAATGIYDIRGFGAKRKLPHFDDLLFLGASISRYPLEGYREKCGTDVTLGTRFAKKPITLKIPITIAGMSFGSLSAPAKEALGRGASRRRHLDHDRRRRHDARRSASTPRCWSTRCCPRATAWNPDQLRKADAIEVVVGPGRQARRRRHAARARRSPSASPRCARCPRASTSARPAGIRTGPARTISRSRSRSCARSPTGRSRSTSRSARRGPTTTRRWP